MNDASADDDLIASLVEQYAAQRRDRQNPSIEEFAQAHPHLADRIRRVLNAARLLDNVQPPGEPTQAGSPPLDPDPTEIGEFRIVRMIGRGGMGVVYEAEQTSLARRVALKVLPALGRLDPRRTKRFEQEALAVASLHHTNITPIFAVGQENGVPYYAMQLIRGAALDQVIDWLQEFDSTATVSPVAATVGGASESTIACRVAQQLVRGGFAAGSSEADGNGSASAEASQDIVRVSSGPPPNSTSARPSAHWLASATPGMKRKYWNAVAKLAWQIVDALDHAHSQGILHRDIKPSNLLIDDQGHLWITDFGLAKALDQEDLTNTGEMVGTLRYLPPEQLAGKSDARSDLYSLGLTIYELLTLCPANDAPTHSQMIARITRGEIASPRAFDPQMPRDLETIVRKLVAHDPDDRYQSAAATAADLGRYLRDEPVQARRESWRERIARWKRRNPAAARAVATITVTVLIALAALTGLWLNSEVQRLRAVRAEAQERILRMESQRLSAAESAARQFAEESLYAARMSLTQQSYEAADIDTAQRYLSFYDDSRDTADLRSFEWYYWSRRCARLLHSIEERLSIVSVVLSPDGTRLVTGNIAGELHFRDVESRRVTHSIEAHAEMIGQLAMDSAGRQVASCSQDGTVRVWDLATARLVCEWKCDSGVRAVCFAPDDQSIFTAEMNGRVLQWNPATATVAVSYEGHERDVYGLAVGDSGRRLVTSSRDRTIKVWDVETGACTATLTGHDSTVRCVAVSPDGDLIISGDGQGRIALWGNTTSSPQFIDAHSEEVHHIEISPDGKRFVTTSRDDSIKVWSVDHPEVDSSLTMRGHIYTVYEARFTADAKRLVSCGHDKTVKFWDLESPMETEVVDTGDSLVQIALVDAHERGVWSAGDRGQMNLWSGQGQALHRFSAHDSPITCAAYSAAGKYLATAAEDGRVSIWDGKTQELIAESNSHGPVLALEFHPTQALLAFGGSSRWVSLWNFEAREEQVNRLENEDTVRAVAFSPTGDRLAVAGSDSAVRIWNVEERQVEQSLVGHQFRVYALAFLNDGDRLITAGQDRVVRCWDVATGEVIQRYQGHSLSVQAVAISPDGKTLATASSDRTIKLWDLEHGFHKSTLNGHRYPVYDVDFSRDGSLLVSGAADGTLRFWRGE